MALLEWVIPLQFAQSGFDPSPLKFPINKNYIYMVFDNNQKPYKYYCIEQKIEQTGFLNFDNRFKNNVFCKKWKI